MTSYFRRLRIWARGQQHYHRSDRVKTRFGYRPTVKHHSEPTESIKARQVRNDYESTQDQQAKSNSEPSEFFQFQQVENHHSKLTETIQQPVKPKQVKSDSESTKSIEIKRPKSHSEPSGNIPLVQPMTSYNAIVVDDVNEMALLSGPGLQSIKKPDSLPVERVEFLFQQSAVLSWRWDGLITKKQGSRNVASAVRYAKTVGIRHLFVDQISIDQALPADDLLKQVLSFSRLYKTIPVIASYDVLGEDFDSIMLRPWIYSEARLFRYNPTKVVYVGHAEIGTRYTGGVAAFRRLILPEAVCYYEFRGRLDETWRGSFIRTVIGVLLRKIQIADISDFKFIIPPLAPALATGYAAISRNDYLLTTLLLCSSYAGGAAVGEWHDIAQLPFDRYTFIKETPRSGWSSSHTFRDILLDGELVGTWGCKENDYIDTIYYSVYVSPEAESRIVDRLPMTDADRRAYHADGQEALRRSYIVLDNESGPPPEVELISIKL